MWTPLSIVFKNAKQFNQDPFCSSSWVGTKASKTSTIEMFVGVENGSIAETKCCTTGKYEGESVFNMHEVSTCEDCKPGKYNNELAQPACKDCTSGRYNDEFGQSACKDCASGKLKMLPRMLCKHSTII